MTTDEEVDKLVDAATTAHAASAQDCKKWVNVKNSASSNNSNNNNATPEVKQDTASSNNSNEASTTEITTEATSEVATSNWLPNDHHVPTSQMIMTSGNTPTTRIRRLHHVFQKFIDLTYIAETHAFRYLQASKLRSLPIGMYIESGLPTIENRTRMSCLLLVIASRIFLYSAIACYVCLFCLSQGLSWTMHLPPIPPPVLQSCFTYHLYIDEWLLNENHL